MYIVYEATRHQCLLYNGYMDTDYDMDQHMDMDELQDIHMYDAYDVLFDDEDD